MWEGLKNLERLVRGKADRYGRKHQPIKEQLLEIRKWLIRGLILEEIQDYKFLQLQLAKEQINEEIERLMIKETMMLLHKEADEYLRKLRVIERSEHTKNLTSEEYKWTHQVLKEQQPQMREWLKDMEERMLIEVREYESLLKMAKALQFQIWKGHKKPQNQCLKELQNLKISSK